MTAVADYLAERHDVTVICSDARYSESDGTAQDAGKPYPVLRAVSGNYDKNGLLSRAINLWRNSVRLRKLLKSIVRQGDEVLIVTNPAPLLLLAAWMKRRRKYRLSIIVHDVFPENAVAAGIIRSEKNPAYRLLRRVFTAAYGRADNLIVLGRDMKTLFESKLAGRRHKPLITIIENWAAECDANSAQCDNDTVTIKYAGNIGRCQGLEKIVEIFSALPPTSPVRLEIFGSGAVEPQLRQYVRRHDCNNISFGGPYSRAGQFQVLGDCDLSLVTLADGMYGLGVPSKTYNIMAAGKAILFIGHPQSEIALMVRENNIGVTFSPTDTEGLRQWLSALTPADKENLRSMGRRARQLALTTYSQPTILNKYNAIFD